MSDNNTVAVWDPLVRIFHWSLVASFFIAYLTEDDFMGLHAWAGYVATALIAFRVLWGFIGPRHARFSDFVAGPRRAFAYAKEVLTGGAPRYVGHNPAGGFMILLLLAGVALAGVTGIIVYGIDESSGPLASLGSWMPEFVGDIVEEFHELIANAVMGLVFVHILGVAVGSLLHRENLVHAMVTGRKRSN
jgi:cytochrome b